MTDRIAGAWALVIGAALMLAVAFYHPSQSGAVGGHTGGHGSPGAAVPDQNPGHGAAQGYSHDRMKKGTLRLSFSTLVHSGALAGLCLLTFGFLIAVRAAGSDVPLLWLSFTSFAFGSFASLCAATMSGFVTGTAAYAAVAAAAHGAPEVVAAQLPVWMNQAFGFQHFAFASVAALLWAFAWPSGSLLGKAAQFAGAAAGIAGIAVVIYVAGHGSRLNTGEFALFTVVQSVWTMAVALCLMFGEESKNERL